MFFRVKSSLRRASEIETLFRCEDFEIDAFQSQALLVFEFLEF